MIKSREGPSLENFRWRCAEGSAWHWQAWKLTLVRLILNPSEFNPHLIPVLTSPLYGWGHLGTERTCKLPKSHRTGIPTRAAKHADSKKTPFLPVGALLEVGGVGVVLRL